ncbi:hypothetical protein LguiA_029063 [Lonicera macranthoides]
MNLNGGKSISRIPEKIIFQILKELPVKTLLRFRAVSKQWCSVIDDPIFVDSHRTRSYTRADGIHILCQYQDELALNIYSTDPEGGSAVPFLTLPNGILCYYNSVDDDYEASCLQSVNGLVCRNYCIWNPSTRESIDLPPVRLNITSEFDLSESTKERCYVFLRNLLGFDSISKQYKVVNMCDIRFGEIRRTEFRILTLGIDLYWRNLDCVPEKLGFWTSFGVCCVDDVIFCSGRVDSTKVIVAFEVGPEKFRVIPPPIGASANSMHIHIIQVGGLLSFVNVDYARAGEVDVDELTTVKVLECLDYVEARDHVNKARNIDYASAGEVDVDELTTFKVLERLDNVEARDHVNKARNIEDVEGSYVMTISILEDYHKQQWKKEIVTFASSWSPHNHLITTPRGSIHTSEILFSHQQYRNGFVYACSYYDLETKSLRMVPKVTAFPNKYQQPEDYDEDDEIDNHKTFVNFTKHVECLFRLK